MFSNLTPSKHTYSWMAGICFVFGCSILNQARAADSTNALLVKLRSPGQSLQHFAASPGHKIRRRFDQFGWVEVALPPESSSATALANYRARPEVLAVEPDVESPAVTDLPQPTFAPASSPSNLPDDPLFPKQWSLARIGAPLAWLNQTGDSNVVVAVLDSGVNYLHEDLQINLWRNPGEIPDNGIDDDGNGWVDDVFGIDTADAAQNDSDPFDRGLNGYYHGSLIAGIIGATSQNHLGIAGMNWSVRIMAVRTIRGNNTITTSDELEALNYVLMMKRRGVNIRAVNMSYGGLSFSVAERDALAALADSGILLCASAGNSGTDNDITPNYPSSYPLPGIIAVAASDELDHLAAFPFSGSSQYGRTSVDLAAPGLHVISTFGPAPDSYESEFFGTSAATPHVTAAVALLAAANPAATSQEIKAALVESVDVLPAFTNKMVSNGRLNLARAIDHPFIARGPATIARSPTNQSVVLSNRVTFDAIVFGAKPRNVQWSHNDQILTGATNENLILSNVSFDLAGDYALVVSNSLASATSTVARLTVLPLQITNQPHEIAVRSGGTARLSVSVLSPVPVTYQWFFGSQILNGATNQTLNIPKVKLTNDGDYHVIVANRFGTGTSEVARLTVLINPGITVAPISQGVVQGGSATFSVALSGNPLPFGVQWLQGTAAKSSNTVAAFQDASLRPVEVLPRVEQR